MMLQQLAVFENLELNIALNENMFDCAFRPERSQTYLVFHFAYICQEYFIKYIQYLKLRGYPEPLKDD